MRSVLDDIQNGTNIADAAKQRSSALNVPDDSPEESAQAKEMPSETVNDGDQVPFAAQNVSRSATGPEIVQPEIKPTAKKPLTYGDIFRELNPDPIPSEEDLKKEQKREKTRALISALGDGISAISNLYSTTKGAVPVPATPTLSERNTARYNEIVNRRLKKADERKQALTNSMLMDKQQDYRAGRDKVEDQHYSDNLDYRNKKQDLAQAQYLADLNYKNLNLSLNKEKYDNQHEETKRHNQATEGIGKAKLGLEGQRVAIADRNEKRLEQKKLETEKKVNKVRVYDVDGSVKSVSTDLMSDKEYFGYARNALMLDGVLPLGSSLNDVYKILKDPSKTNKSKKLQELRSKAAPNVFIDKHQKKESVSTSPVMTAQPAEAQQPKSTQPTQPKITITESDKNAIQQAINQGKNDKEKAQSVMKTLRARGYSREQSVQILKNLMQ